MSSDEAKDLFQKQAAEWVCNSYCLGISYLATRQDDVVLILDAVIIASPLPPEKIVNFSVEAGTLIAGQQIYPSLSKTKIMRWLETASMGEIRLGTLKLTLETGTKPEYFSSIQHGDIWFSPLDLQITGAKLSPASLLESVNNDHCLRCADPPFDGLADLGGFLQLSDVRVSGQAPKISIRVIPPVDMDFSASKLNSNRFDFSVVAHPKFDVSQLGLALREAPGSGVETRKQVGQVNRPGF